jgi:FkbM family methyltransferase
MSRWRNKIRRRFYSPYNKVVHRGRYFICRYFGAAFLVRSGNVGGLEISAKIAEHDELKNFIRGTAAIKPDVFIDIGANLGLYTCILMKNRLVPRAILFEPDRRNRVHLGANLLINGLLDADLAIHPVALGAAAGRLRLVPGRNAISGSPRSSRALQRGKAMTSRSSALMISLRSPAARSQSRSMSSAMNAKCSPAWHARYAKIVASCR